MKKVLIITYYWPPSGGPGVQRVLKFAKYLPQFGWQALILTVKNGEYPALDPSLEKDIPESCLVYKTASLEPNALYKRFIGQKSDQPIPVAAVAEKNKSWKKRFAAWIRLNLFIPDAKIGWYPFAIKKGKEIIKKEKPVIILSSSPPPTVNLIARKLSRWGSIKWVADFRDPWTDIYHFDEIKKSWHSRLIESRMENNVLRSADYLITVSEGFKKLFENKTGPMKNFSILPNGYDPEDFNNTKELKLFSKFTLCYAGKLNAQQNPEKLWQALKLILSKNKDFKENLQILVMGKLDEVIIKSINKFGLSSFIKDLGYVEHAEVIKNLCQSHLLLLVMPDTKSNKGILPGKIFEYLATKRPLIAIGPQNSDAGKLIAKTNSGQIFSFVDDPAPFIQQKYNEYKSGKYQQIRVNIDHFTRKHLTGELAKILNQMST